MHVTARHKESIRPKGILCCQYCSLLFVNGEVAELHLEVSDMMRATNAAPQKRDPGDFLLLASSSSSHDRDNSTRLDLNKLVVIYQSNGNDTRNIIYACNRSEVEFRGLIGTLYDIPWSRSGPRASGGDFAVGKPTAPPANIFEICHIVPNRERWITFADARDIARRMEVQEELTELWEIENGDSYHRFGHVWKVGTHCLVGRYLYIVLEATMNFHHSLSLLKGPM